MELHLQFFVTDSVRRVGERGEDCAPPAMAVFASHGVPSVTCALCPIVEGALVRFLVRAGESYTTAQAVLAGFYASPRCAFWPDSISFTAADLPHVVGHRQVTDGYLAALAVSRGGLLATFDEALADVLLNETELIR
jgi:uncharacterized protein